MKSLSLIAVLPFFVCGLAFVVFPFGFSWYESPKAVIALLGVSGLGLALLRKELSGRVSLLHFWAQVVMGSIFLFSVWHLWMNDSSTALLGNHFRHQGTLLLWGGLVVLVLSAATPRSKLLPVFAWLSLAATLLAIPVFPVDPAGRAVGTLGEASSLGAYALFLWPFLRSRASPGSMVVAALLAVALVVFFSGSRSALVGLVASGAFIGLSGKLGQARALAVSSLLLGFSVFLPFFAPAQTFDSRSTVWHTAVAAGWERPIVGWGFGNTEHGLRAAAQELGTSLRYQYVDSSHNVVLDWWVQGGALGVLLFGSLLFLAVRGLLRKRETDSLAALIGVTAVMLFNPVSVAVLVPFFWLLGRGVSRLPAEFAPSRP